MATRDPFAYDDQNIEPSIEETPEGLIIVGEDEIDLTAENDDEGRDVDWDDNLIDLLSSDELALLGSNVISDYDDDVASRKDWQNVYEQGLKTLAPEQDAGSSADAARASKHLSTLIHPVIAEAATEFQAKAIGELFPSQGPVGTIILGDPTEEKMEQAARAAKYMNYQLTEEMEEYFPDHDQMLFHLPLIGHTFKKCYFDEVLGRITSRFVRAENLVVDGNATSLGSALRTTEVLNMNKVEFRRYVVAKFWEDVDTETPQSDNGETLEMQIEGRTSPISQDSGTVTLLEQHRYEDIEDGYEMEMPYIVTVHEDTQQVVAIRRNWEEEDETHAKEVWYVDYKFLPGLGFYGFGLYHLIGGLGRAATGALRSLLDAAAYANMQGGFKLRGRVKGGEVEVAPGEFVDVDAAVDDINKAIMALPFKEPSQTMMALLQYVVEVAKRFANTASTNISDANQNTPVGTTMALLEEGAKVFSAIHKRLHRSQRREFKLIAKLNGIYLPDTYPYLMKEEDQYVLRTDFDDRIDIIPTSDPATFSSTQRIAQAQASLQMATQFPQHHNMHKALERMYKALRTPNFEEILIDPLNTHRMDAATENIAMMMGKPLRAYLDQDHASHLKVLDDWFQRLGPEGQQPFIQGYMSHRAEHLALLYRAEIQNKLASKLPELPDFRDPNAEVKDIDPALDKQISEAAAMLTNIKTDGPLGPPQPPMQKPGQGDPASDPMAAAKLLAEVEMMSIKAKTQADVESKQAKAQSDMQIKQMESQLDMQIERARADAKFQADQMRENMKAEADRNKVKTALDAVYMKAEADIQIARERAQNDMIVERERGRVQAEIARATASAQRSVPE